MVTAASSADRRGGRTPRTGRDSPYTNPIRSTELNRANAMVILVALMTLWMVYEVTEPLRAQHASAPSPTPAQLAHAQPPIGAEPNRGNQATPAWTALDDLQLTRLLTNSTHEPPPDRTPA